MKIDVNKTSRVWDFLVQAGFLKIGADLTVMGSGAIASGSGAGAGAGGNQTPSGSQAQSQDVVMNG